MTYTISELTIDSKMVYNGTQIDLVSLAEKYNVATRRLQWWLESDHFQVPFPTKSDQKEIQGTLYATIKGEIRKLQS